MDNEWDQYAESWDNDPTTSAYAAAAFDSLTELVQASGLSLQGANVLDFGCGTGLLTEHLVVAGATIDAVDTSTAMLNTLAAKIDRHGWSTVRTSTILPEPSPRFDLVVCSSVCAFLPDYPSAVQELVTYLRPDGLFVQWDWEQTGDNDHGLTRTQIHRALTASGLADVGVRTGFSIEVNDQAMSPLMGYGRQPLDPRRQHPAERATGRVA